MNEICQSKEMEIMYQQWSDIQLCLSSSLLKFHYICSYVCTCELACLYISVTCFLIKLPFQKTPYIFACRENEAMLQLSDLQHEQKHGLPDCLCEPTAQSILFD